jgi:hypothetical protein
VFLTHYQLAIRIQIISCSILFPTLCTSRHRIILQWLCYRLDDPGFQSRQGQETSLFSKMFRLTGDHPASYHWVTQFVLGSKAAKSVKFYNHSPPFIAEVKPFFVYGKLYCLPTLTSLYFYHSSLLKISNSTLTQGHSKWDMIAWITALAFP